MNKKFIDIFIKNFVNLSLNQGLNILISVIITPILFQNLGSSQFGLVNLSFSIFILISIVVSYGYHLNAPKNISLLNNIKLERNLISEIISLRFFIAFTASLLIILITLTTNLFNDYELIILCSIPILFSESLHPIFYLQGKNNLYVLPILNAIAKLLYLGLIVVSINSPYDGFKVNLLYGISISLVYTIHWIKFFLKNRIAFYYSNFKKIKKMIKDNFEFFFSSFAGHISIHSSLIILKPFSESDELGKFALANKIALLLRMIPVFMVQSVLQSASSINKNNNSALNGFINYYYYRGLFVTLSIGILIALLSKWVIFIFSGEDIIYSSQILSMLSFMPFLAMLNFRNILLILVNERKVILNKATWISTFFMLSSAMVLSYYYKGFGLATAILISELFSFFIHYLLLLVSDE